MIVASSSFSYVTMIVKIVASSRYDLAGLFSINALLDLASIPLIINTLSSFLTTTNTS